MTLFPRGKVNSISYWHGFREEYMTTKFTIPPDLFAGKTVAVLASGAADMSAESLALEQELADAVRHLPRICARWAIKRAPDADMCIAVDAPPNVDFWPYALANFKGLKLTAVETDALPDVMFWWHRWEMITISEVPSHVIEIRNNGMSAIHLAEQGGAAKILLLGFYPEKAVWFYDTDQSTHAPILYHGLAEGLAQLTAKLRARGVEVEYIRTMEDVRKHAPAPEVVTHTNTYLPISGGPIVETEFEPEQRLGWNKKRK
ncbi:MAG: hypothetical protein NUV34_08990 [Sulfuricaulis sp.]|nr:hypothetical protein [Sulfuricaulis sp.]